MMAAYKSFLYNNNKNMKQKRSVNSDSKEQQALPHLHLLIIYPPSFPYTYISFVRRHQIGGSSSSFTYTKFNWKKRGNWATYLLPDQISPLHSLLFFLFIFPISKASIMRLLFIRKRMFIKEPSNPSMISFLPHDNNESRYLQIRQ